MNLLTPTTICSPASIASSRARVGFDQLRLHVADLDRGDRAAHCVDLVEFGQRFLFQRLDLAAISGLPSKISPYSSRSVS